MNPRTPNVNVGEYVLGCDLFIHFFSGSSCHPETAFPTLKLGVRGQMCFKGICKTVAIFLLSTVSGFPGLHKMIILQPHDLMRL